MLVTAYNFTLNHSLPVGLVTINKFDGHSPSLASCTTGGKILVHTPHSKDSNDIGSGLKSKDVQYLNVNKDVVCLSGGKLDKSIDREILLIGSKTNLLTYDINENADVFDKEVQDGINWMAFSDDLNPDYPLVITGGNLSITGFDYTSEEQFWTVTGGVANSMAVLDFDFDGDKELIVGSDDYNIRIYKGEEMIYDINEDSKIQLLAKVEKALFAYSLSNGTIGCYSGSAKKWSKRIDSKITTMLGIDFEMDGGKQLMIGYNSGKFEVRNASNGNVNYTSNMGSTVSKIMYEDYRLDGNKQAIVWNTDGDVKGFNLTLDSSEYDLPNHAHKKESEAINKMNLEIHALKEELDTDVVEKREKDASELAMNVPTGIEIEIIPSTIPNSACIYFAVKSPLIVRYVIMFSDKLFENGTYVSYPNKPTNKLMVPVNSDKNMECEIDWKIAIGKSFESDQYMTVHARVIYKKFGFFKNIPFAQDYSNSKAPLSQISYKIRERPNRVLLWAEKVFNLDKETDQCVLSKSDSLDFMLLNVKTDWQLIVQARSQSDGTLLQISYDDLETVGDMIQDLCQFINIDHISPEKIHFPQEKESITELIETITELDKLRDHFSANIAESVNNAKVFVVKGEFSLMLGDMASLK